MWLFTIICLVFFSVYNLLTFENKLYYYDDENDEKTRHYYLYSDKIYKPSNIKIFIKYIKTKWVKK